MHVLRGAVTKHNIHLDYQHEQRAASVRKLACGGIAGVGRTGISMDQQAVRPTLAAF